MHGGGLRGGRWSLTLSARQLRCGSTGSSTCPGIRVSGTIRSFGERREHSILRLSGPRTPDGVLQIGSKWIVGRLDGKQVRSRLPGGEASAAAAGRAARPSELLGVARRVARARRMH